jgi:hypothetical protein
VTPVAAPPVTMTQAAPIAPLSPQDLLRPREPFSLYQRRGTGQLLFDMGISGDFVGSLTQKNVDKANGGTFAGRENRFFPREVELGFFGQIDPYARADVRVEAGEETPGAETGVALAEATLTLLALPYGTQAKLGQMRNRFGYQNVSHEHDLPWIDRPSVFRYFLGDEGFTEKGLELTWVPDLPFYLELLGGVFNGDNSAAFGRGKLSEPLLTGRARTFIEINDENAVQLGISGARGQTIDRKQSNLAGFDLRYKLRPEGWLHPLFTLTGEALYAIRRLEVIGDPQGTGEFGENRQRNRFGWYAGVEVQPVRRWAAGLRYDWTEYPINPGKDKAVEPYLTYMPSEFLRFRLAYKHTDRSHRDTFTNNGGSARIADEVLFQGTFILGAHPAHPF